MKRYILFLTAFLTLSNASLARGTDAPDMIGPKVGKPLPVALTLKDQNGDVKKLEDMVGDNGIILVFYRSADWCPYCRLQLIDLQQNAYEQAKAKGYSVAAISYDPIKILDKFSRQFSIEYPLLSDEGSKVINGLGLRNPAYEGKSRFYGIPYPIVIILDKNGVVKAKLHEKSYRKRPKTSDILNAL